MNELIKKHQEKFSKLFELYTDYNSHTNISSIRDKEGVYQKHFLDSLQVANSLGSAKKIIDIGCGGGFPVLPLAICFPKKQFLALDSVGKKIKFIEQVKQELGLENLETQCARAEVLAHDPKYREQFDIALTRAVAEFRMLLEFSVPFVKRGGQFIAYKKIDIREELDLAKNAIKRMNLSLKQEMIYKLEDESERKLMIFEKKSKGSAQYPRDPAKIKANPL